MPPENDPLTLKEIGKPEWQDVARFIHSETPVHRHLGWRSPLDWLGSQPFLGAYRGGGMVGVLACPPNADGITWLRLFAVAEGEDMERVWAGLWSAARADLADQQDVENVSVLAMHSWMADLLRDGPFQKTYDVAVMEWDAGHAVYPEEEGEVRIRSMQEGDLPEVYDIDREAFEPLWRNSLEGLRVALEAASVATVAEKEGAVVGYQISTADSLGGHLARLAVHPGHQNQRVGTALVRDVLREFERRGVVRVSVNTQKENKSSIRLYEKFGFRMSDETYPVYQHFF